LHLLHPSGAPAYSAGFAGIFAQVKRIDVCMQITRRLVITLGIAAALPLFAESKADPINKDKSNIAIKGYDPVAYFVQSKPVKGSASFTSQWMNSTWWFASAEDRDEFARNPEKYAPQYGGYCAYGVSQGHTAPIDPEAWTIVEGKLYLNYSKGVKKTWSEAIPKHVEEANRNWPGLHK
jgi:YHS domain-containing protein